MDHYLFTARSVTHAQRMAQILGRVGVPVRMRRAGNSVTKNGCGYTLQIAERKYGQAIDALHEAGVRPVGVFHVVNGERREVTV